MTRLTNDLRTSLLYKIMKGLPNRDYIGEIHSLVQDTIAEFMPKEVKVLYDKPDMRGYLTAVGLDVRSGNRPVPMFMRKSSDEQRRDEVVGLKSRLTVRMDDAENAQRLSEGSLYRALVTRLYEKGLVEAYFQQEELRRDVERRLKANLAAATTIKRLYEVLEPELHHYIPKETGKDTLPACVAPVVDDLKKLGLVLPETPKVAS